MIGTHWTVAGAQPIGELRSQLLLVDTYKNICQKAFSESSARPAWLGHSKGPQQVPITKKQVQSAAAGPWQWHCESSVSRLAAAEASGGPHDDSRDRALSESSLENCDMRRTIAFLFVVSANIR